MKICTTLLTFLTVHYAAVGNAQTLNNMNGIRFVSGYSGSDLGARINSAVANCQSSGGPCNLYVDISGTISTPPDVPAGYSITFGPGTYTLATTLPINHTNTTWNFEGAVLNYALDSGGQAVWIGKNIYGTATSCTTASCNPCPPSLFAIKWSSGTQFTDIDPGDSIFFNGGTYNIASATATTVCVLGSPGNVNTPAAFGVFLSGNTNLGIVGPILVNNLDVHYAARTRNTAIDAIHIEAVSGLSLNNVLVTNFGGGTSSAVNCIACISDKFVNVTAVGNAQALNLDGKRLDGVINVDSNENDFFGYDFLANTGGQGGAVQWQGRAANNRFFGGRYEGNSGGYAVVISRSGICSGNVWYGPYFERNGNGTTGSADFLQQCGENSVYDGSSTSGVSKTPASGYVAEGSRTLMNLTHVAIGGAYTTAISYQSGSTGKVVRPNIGSIPYIRGNAQFEDTSGFTGTKTAGSCLLTISGGIITNVTGC